MSDWVQIIHPETGGIGEVHRSALPQHYAAGWRLLAPDEVPQPEQAPEPEPVTRKQAAKAAKTESEEK
jgi:hypothetical protein